MTGSTVRTCVDTPILDTLRLTFTHHVRRVVTQRQPVARKSNAVQDFPAGQGTDRPMARFGFL